ncbi:hypothetical protein Tco_1255366 [Tanacetum coccineum]
MASTISSQASAYGVGPGHLAAPAAKLSSISNPGAGVVKQALFVAGISALGTSVLGEVVECNEGGDELQGNGEDTTGNGGVGAAACSAMRASMDADIGGSDSQFSMPLSSHQSLHWRAHHLTIPSDRQGSQLLLSGPPRILYGSESGSGTYGYLMGDGVLRTGHIIRRWWGTGCMGSLSPLSVTMTRGTSQSVSHHRAPKRLSLVRSRVHGGMGDADDAEDMAAE